MLQAPPLFSTFTLFTEVFVTISVLYILYSGYKHNKFHTKLVALTLSYEILFNITYMATRAAEQKKAPTESHSAFYIATAAFHGIFSLLMFALLVVFFVIAWRKYKKDINFFRAHRILTLLFTVFWFVAIFSGILFYYLAYFTRL